MNVRCLVLLVALLPSSTMTVRADDTTYTFRVEGLSSTERIDDLHEVLKERPAIRAEKVDVPAAEVVFVIDKAKLFPELNNGPEQSDKRVQERLDQELSSLSQGTFRVKEAVKPADTLVKLEIQLGILDCKACRFAAYSVVTRIEGVDRAFLDRRSHLLTAWIDDKKTNQTALKEALKNAQVEIVK